MKARLLGARRLLATVGWVGPRHEPFCITREPGLRLNAAFGPGCSESESMLLHANWHHTLDVNSEGLALFSVHGALLASGAYPEGWELLERVIGTELQAWLKDSKRTSAEVLRLFTTAVLRSAREKRT